MADRPQDSKPSAEVAATRPETVMQVERHDYPDLAPQNGKRTQPMQL